MNRSIATVLSALFLTPLLAFPVLAMESREASAVRVNNSGRLSRGSKADLAVDQLIAAILEDVANADARAELKKIAKARAQWPTQKRMSLLRFVELTDYIHFLRSRGEYLQRDNALLLDFLLTQKGLESHAIEAARTIQAEWQRHDQDHPVRDEDFQELLRAYHGDGLGKLNAALARLKDVMLDRMTALQAANRRLREQKHKALNRLARIQRERPAESQVKDIRMRVIEKDLLLRKQEDNYARLNREMEEVRREFAAVQERLQETNQRIAELTRDLAGMSLEKFSKEKMLADRENRVSLLEGELRDAQERLSLVQRIIQEKDQHIQTLEQEMTVLQTSGEGEVSRTAIGDLRQDLSTMKDQWTAQSQINVDKIAALEQNLALLNERYSALERTLAEKENEIVALRESASSKDQELSQYHKIFISKDRKIMELNGIVTLYKGRLEDTWSTLKERSKTLNSLQRQMEDLELRLDDVRNVPATYPGHDTTSRPSDETLSDDSGGAVPRLTRGEILLRAR